MNVLLLARLFLSLKDAQSRISQEAEEFENKHKIDSPRTRRMAHLISAGKVLLLMSIMGELPFLDVFRLVSFNDRLFWLGVLVVTGSALVLLLFFMMLSEKEQQRDQIVRRETQAYKIELDKGRQEQREYRRSSKFLHDF